MGLNEFMEREAERDARVRAVVEAAGAIYHGIQKSFKHERESFATVTDPVTRSTFLVPLSQVTDGRIRAEMAAMRKKFGKES